MNTRRRVTRRGFLGTTAAASLASPLVIPGSALGLEDRPAASERVVTAFIGMGPRGRQNLHEQLICPEAQIAAVCDVWKARREMAKKSVDTSYGNTNCQACTDFREIISREDIDAVSIGTPDHWHVPIAIAAAKAGKDVCLEKPMGVSLAQDIACREAMKRYDRVFQYGTEARKSAACRLGAELVRNGRIGEIREIRVKSPNSHRGGSHTPRPVPDDLDYEMWLGPAPWRPYSGCPDSGNSWYHVYDYALGFIAGWGAHPLDLLVWAFDTHLTGPWEVEGTGSIDTVGRNDAVCDWDVNFQMGGGVRMNYFASGVKKDDEEPQLANLGNYVQLIGTEGWIAIWYIGVGSEPKSIKDAGLGPNDLRLPVSEGQEKNFIECVLNRKTPVSNIDDAVRSDTISHISDIAIRHGRKITWNPIKEQIIDDEEASRRLSRAIRPPWSL